MASQRARANQRRHRDDKRDDRSDMHPVHRSVTIANEDHPISRHSDQWSRLDARA